LLFTDVNWEGHKQLEGYLKSIKGDLRKRYGKELSDILTNSLWTTREYPRGSSSTYQDSNYKNLTGLVSDKGYIWHEHNSGANLKGATISGGMPGSDFRYDCSDAWLKNATLIKHKEDDRRDFKGESFKGANLCGAKIIDANMEGADFSKADLRHVTWTNTCVNQAKFDKANCMDTQIPEVKPAPAVEVAQTKAPEVKPDASFSAKAAVAGAPADAKASEKPEPKEPVRRALKADQHKASHRLHNVAGFFSKLFHKHDKEKTQTAEH
jgi:hypothetical protein